MSLDLPGKIRESVLKFPISDFKTMMSQIATYTRMTIIDELF